MPLFRIIGMRFVVQLAFYILLSTSTAMAAQTVGTQLLDDPVRSDVDQRAYRNIELTNGMKVLLISDPAADKAAAAVDVATGSNNDPVQRQGLAHFLEHMLFLGTKKFPNSGEYQAFINAHGGSHNAFTSLEHTNYFFDIAPSQLKPALERFSQFFVAPLFDAAYVEREKNAVNAEYKARINDDARRINDVYRELYARENPAARFSVGNLDTLADRPEDKVRDALLAYYKQYYSANTMTMVVLGREPLSVLQAMVEQYFSDVPDRHVIVDTSAKPVFRQDLLPAKVVMQSKRDERHLVLTFPLPTMQPFYRTKPDVYVSYLLGHEGEGSLLHVLKQKGWAERLVAGSGFSNRFAASMDVDIKLTHEGYQHIDDVVALFFYAVDLLRQNGVEAWRYQEQKNMLDIAFRFAEKGDDTMYVSSLANNLQYFPAKEVIRGSYLMDGLDKKQVEAVLEQIRPDNMLISVSAPDIDGQQRSRYYDTSYDVVGLSQAEVQAWRHPLKNSGIALPGKNIFVPENLKLKQPSGEKTAVYSVPEKISASESSNLWFMQDVKFNVPKGNVMVYMFGQQAGDSARHAVMAELFVRLLKDQLNPSLYEAQLSGLDFFIERRSRGISFSLSGYSEKQAELLKIVMDVLQKPVFHEERFRLLKTQLGDELRNVDKQSPYLPLMADVPAVLVHGYWERKQSLQVLDAITLNDVQQFMQGFIQGSKADILVYGNFYKDDARNIGKIIRNVVDASHKTESNMPSLVAALKPLAQPALYVDAMEHNDAALVKYFQAPADDTVQQVNMLMLNQVLASPFFDSLRTEQQLGYIVGGRYLPLVRVAGLAFFVQSPSHSVADINTRTDAFIKQYFSVIEKKDDAWFEQQKKALMVKLEEKPKNQSEQAEQFFSDLILGYTAFDSLEQKINTLKKMTRQDLLDVYRTILLAPEKRELLLVSPGKAGIQSWLNSEAKAFYRIDDVDDFKKNQSSYSLR